MCSADVFNIVQHSFNQSQIWANEGFVKEKLNFCLLLSLMLSFDFYAFVFCTCFDKMSVFNITKLF